MSDHFTDTEREEYKAELYAYREEEVYRQRVKEVGETIAKAEKLERVEEQVAALTEERDRLQEELKTMKWQMGDHLKEAEANVQALEQAQTWRDIGSDTLIDLVKSIQDWDAHLRHCNVAYSNCLRCQTNRFEMIAAASRAAVILKDESWRVE